MDPIRHEHAQLTEEIRVLKKISNAAKIANTLRKSGNELAANCIESLIREIERAVERQEGNAHNEQFRRSDGE
jgi:hypothetical protein